MPLLTNSDGKKMGKTETGAVWMDESLMAPFDFWQYWRNIDDRDVTKLMKLFTDIDIAEIDTYDALIGTKEMNAKKIVLADAITSIVHPDVNLESIHNSATGVFNSSDNEILGLDTYAIPQQTRIDKALVITGLASSQTSARRLIDGKGVKIDGNTVATYDALIVKSCLLAVGKKRLVKVLVSDS